MKTMTLILLMVVMTTLPSPAAAPPLAGRAILDLGGRNWQMEGIRPGQGGEKNVTLMIAVCPLRN